VLIPALYWGGSHGVAGVCVALGATGVVFLALSQHLANRLLDIGFGAYFDQLWRPALVAAMTGGAVFGCSPLLPSTPILACAAGGVVALIAGLAALRLCAWKDITDMVAIARGTSAGSGVNTLSNV